MNVQDLKSIVNNVDAQDKLPVCVRVKFSDKQKSDTIVNVNQFHQHSDSFLFVINVDNITDDVVIERLMKFRDWLTERKETWAYAKTLAKFDELFCRTLEDGSAGNS